MKRSKLGIVVLFTLSLVYCATTPDPAPRLPDPGMQSEIEAAREAAALREAERLARLAIARAEDAGAATYDPVTLQQARAALSEGERLRDSDRDGALRELEQAKLKATVAYQNSLGLARRRLELQMNDLLQQLRDHQIDWFAPDEYADAAAAVKRAGDMFVAGRLADGSDAAADAIRYLETLRDTLTAQLTRVLDLRAAVDALMDETEAAGTEQQVRQLNDLYQAGVAALERFALADAERQFGAAREAANSALRGADSGMVEITEEGADGLMFMVMNELEAASLITIITDDEIVVEPVPWEGAEFLGSEGSRATQASAEAEVALGQVPQHALLQQAKALWRLGVAQRNAGDYRRAIANFQQAQRHTASYTAFAIQTIYTVRLIPERRDSLWRIAEYDFIYGNPWLWPKIWHRNRKLIQDPDLIYPGWQLYIPPP